MVSVDAAKQTEVSVADETTEQTLVEQLHQWRECDVVGGCPVCGVAVSIAERNRHTRYHQQLGHVDKLQQARALDGLYRKIGRRNV